MEKMFVIFHNKHDWCHNTYYLDLQVFNTDDLLPRNLHKNERSCMNCSSYVNSIILSFKNISGKSVRQSISRSVG